MVPVRELLANSKIASDGNMLLFEGKPPVRLLLARDKFLSNGAAVRATGNPPKIALFDTLMA